jgi:hypothetical protein
MSRVRSTAELPELPYTFTQRRLLSPSDFVSESRARDVEFAEDHLEALHRARLLVPLLRVRRDTRVIRWFANQGDYRALQLAHSQPTSRIDLTEARAEGNLRDPLNERFISRARRRRAIEDWTYLSSVYLYSPHQLITLPLIRAILASSEFERRSGSLVIRLQAPRVFQDNWYAAARKLQGVVIALCALEPRFYPQVVDRLTVPWTEDLADFQRWRTRKRTRTTLDWLGSDPDWFWDTGVYLANMADGFDPLGDWIEVIAEGEPAKWTKLRGQARSAMDQRIASEMLLSFHDDLVRARLAPRAATAPERAQLHSPRRLRRQRPLDELLTDFGLSPHPHLILVLEGQTELALLPRVMQLLQISSDDDFIRIENAEGVDRDLSSLVAYAAAPRVEVDDDRYLRLLRPPTRILVVFDAEGTVATDEARQAKRDGWVERILRALPMDDEREPVREQVETLVDVITWNGRGESFEFAHFTDRQLAVAIDGVDQAHKPPTTKERIKWVASVRASGGNLDVLLGSVSKIELAEELWPLLEGKLRRAIRRKTVARIPVARVLFQAHAMASEFPRKNLVIGLSRREAG